MSIFIFQKQYVFIHRALMEHAQFGNTEVTSKQLHDIWSTHLRHDSSSDNTSTLQKDFEVLLYFFLVVLNFLYEKSRSKMLLNYFDLFILLVLIILNVTFTNKHFSTEIRTSC